MRVNDELGPQFQAAHAHHGGRVEECRMNVLPFPQLVGHENGGNFDVGPKTRQSALEKCSFGGR
jgi:hypothetical protein